MWQIDLSLVKDWLLSLDSDSYDQVNAAIELLERLGPALGRPLVDTIQNSNIKNLKELRPGSAKRSELRLLFVFDPRRWAIFLVAGDKSGDWDKWYRRNISIAEQRYSEYLRTRLEQ